ncbi:MAG: hypothetical protein LBI27_05275 [Clostridiales bacterium]|jgi:hypothetical protein|nr:hypothetical protein [Clostridiales bacterium]
MEYSFNEQVENHLRTKSLRELKSLVIRLAATVPNTSQQRIFLDVLEDKRVIIDKQGEKTDAEKTLADLQSFYDEIGNYCIDAHYNDGYGWGSQEGFVIQDDDGFAADFTQAYYSCERLLTEGQYSAAAKAFRLLFNTMIKFNEVNKNNDFGAIYISTFVEAGLFDIDSNRAKALRGYSAFMANESDLRNDLIHIYRLCVECGSNLTFKDVLEAGNETVPDIENILAQWVEILFEQPPRMATPLVKEAALLSDRPEIMEQYVKSVGLSEPLAHLTLCEMLIEQESLTEKIIEAATYGLKHTEVDASLRDKLATLLADNAKRVADHQSYTYAVMERFYSCKNLETYLPVIGLNSPETNLLALSKIEMPKTHTPHDNIKADYYIIQMLNGMYYTAFDAIKSNESSIGWSTSLKGTLFPFFIALLSGFDSSAVTIKKLVSKKINNADINDVYKILKKNRSVIPVEQEKTWYNWCIKETMNRIDAILTKQHRGAYERAAWLLVAMCEVQTINKQEAPLALVRKYLEKYFRQRAFLSEVKMAMSDAGMRI